MRACSRRTPAPADGCSRSVSSRTFVRYGVWSGFELCPALYIGTVSGIATPLYPAPTGGGLPPPPPALLLSREAMVIEGTGNATFALALER